MNSYLYRASFHTIPMLAEKPLFRASQLSNCEPHLPAILLVDQEFGGAIKSVKDYKSFSDNNIIDARRPYGTVTEKFKRRIALGGTSNEINVHQDITGNRRILPINVDKIDYNSMLEFDKVALLMEAYHMLKSGFNWVIQSQDDIKYIYDNTQENQEIMPFEELFFVHFHMTQSETHNIRKVFNRGEIIEYMNAYLISKVDGHKIKDVCVKNDLDYKTHNYNGKSKKGIELFVRPAFESVRADL